VDFWIARFFEVKAEACHEIPAPAFFLRGQVDPSAISAQVRTQIQSVNAELSVFRAETLDHVLLFACRAPIRHGNGGAVWRHSPAARGLGTYGTISYLVHEQSREIASRWARLGAISSGWFCTKASLWPPPARVYAWWARLLFLT
jgi:hypothetical protein